jgi:carboxyl-terminal processing protease
VKKVFVVMIVIVLIFSGMTGAYADTVDPFDYARTVYEYIIQNYYGDIDEDLLAENLIKAIAASLDDYSVYMTNDEAEAFYDDMSGEYEGIGITFLVTDKGPRVVSVMRGSPAKEAGILPGDHITGINGANTAGMGNEEIAALVRGAAGEPVVLTIMREGMKELMEFTLIREKITVSSVEYRLINDDIGYIRISSFNGNTYDQARAALTYFDKRGIVKIVMDLRNNGGGLVSQAVMTAGLFVTEGVITTLDYENPEYPDLTYVSSLKGSEYELKVLVNENTASAAELFAAAVKERDAGTIIGTVTFGKGIFQTGQYLISYLAFVENYENAGVMAVFPSQLDAFGIFMTPDETGGYLHMTSGRYLTPDGNDINGIGLIPDIYVLDAGTADELNNIDRTSDSYNYDAGKDELVILNAKAILKQLGYFEGAADTAYTDEFREALGEFQKDSGLVITRGLNYITRRMLDFCFDRLLCEEDVQLKKAIGQFN